MLSNARQTAPLRQIDSATSAILRRSYMSAIAPDAIAPSISGANVADWTIATRSARSVICVIAQAAPTPWISTPKLENRLAHQIRRNKGSANGVNGPLKLPPCPLTVSLLASLAKSCLPLMP